MNRLADQGNTRMGSKTRRVRPIGLVVLSFAVALAIAGAVALGALDRFASDGSVDRTGAIGALIVYWLLFSMIVWLVPLAIRHRKETTLCIVSIAAALILADIVLRILVPRTSAVEFEYGGISSRQFHHIYPAHARMYMGRFEGKDVFVETNEDGLRTPYSRDGFRQYRKRVVVLGDSFTLGVGVTSEDSFPRRLEENLRRTTGDEGIAVLNAGILSYSPFLEKLLFERKLEEYRPDLVLLFLDATDIGDDYWYMKESERADKGSNFPLEDGTPPSYRGALYELTRPYHRLLASSLRYPLTLARRLAGAGHGESTVSSETYDYYEFEVQVGNTTETNRYFIYRHPLDMTRGFFDRTLGNVDEIAGLARRMGAGFALFVTPRFHHWNIRECPQNWERTEYKLQEPYQYEYFRYFEESRRTYPIINLLPDFLAADRYPLVFRQDPHWNAAGHAFVAETVTKHLLERRLLDSPASQVPQPSADSSGMTLPKER